MSIFEYDEELHMATLKKESWEDGWQQGSAWGIGGYHTGGSVPT